jgi:hypothetical protein
VGLARAKDGTLYLVFEVSGQKFLTEQSRVKINQLAGKMGAIRADPASPDKTRNRDERAEKGAPMDAEQLLIDGVEDRGWELLVIIASRDYCPACAHRLQSEGVVMLPPFQNNKPMYQPVPLHKPGDEKFETLPNKGGAKLQPL